MNRLSQHRKRPGHVIFRAVIELLLPKHAPGRLLQVPSWMKMSDLPLGYNAEHTVWEQPKGRDRYVGFAWAAIHQTIHY